MLYDYYKYFLNYLIYLYGGSYEVKNKFLYMYIDEDVFIVNLLDGSRFNKFTFYHQNHVANKHFHKQLTCKDLECGIFRCFTHAFNKKYDIPYSKEDWICFEKDALKYKMLDSKGE